MQRLFWETRNSQTFPIVRNVQNKIQESSKWDRNTVDLGDRIPSGNRGWPQKT